MKKLISLFCLVVLLGISVHVMGQNTGLKPQIGGTYPYSVTLNGTNTYLWSVTTDVAGATPATGVVLSSTTGNSITITWNNVTIGSNFYVHVIETASGSGSCTNRKALTVVPTNNLNLNIISITTLDQATDANPYSTCPPNVTVNTFDGTFDGTLVESRKFTYGYGTVDLYYKISATGINTTSTGWKTTVNIINTATGGTVTAAWDYVIGGTYSSALTVLGADNVITVAATHPDIFIRVRIANSTTYEATASHTATVTLKPGANNNEDQFGNDAVGLGNGNRVQTVNPRPATTVITTTP